jgi:DNA-directed RNA polymerase I, II, and III subunit RPABC1
MAEAGAPRYDYSDTQQGRFWMSLRTVTEMLFDRYQIQVPIEPYESVVKKLRFLDLADTERSQQLMSQFDLAIRRPDDTMIRVFWLCGKVGVKTESIINIQKLYTTIQDDLISGDFEDADDEQAAELVEAQKGQAALAGKSPDTIILIQVENCTITPPARKVAAKIPAIIEIFDCEFLMTNKTKNRYQPKYTLLSQTEAEDVKRKYCASDSQLPKLGWEDPMRRYFGLRVSQIVRIIRMSDAGKEVYYRIVIPPSVSKKNK